MSNLAKSRHDIFRPHTPTTHRHRQPKQSHKTPKNKNKNKWTSHLFVRRRQEHASIARHRFSRIAATFRNYLPLLVPPLLLFSSLPPVASGANTDTILAPVPLNVQRRLLCCGATDIPRAKLRPDSLVLSVGGGECGPSLPRLPDDFFTETRQTRTGRRLRERGGQRHVEDLEQVRSSIGAGSLCRQQWTLRCGITDLWLQHPQHRRHAPDKKTRGCTVPSRVLCETANRASNTQTPTLPQNTAQRSPTRLRTGYVVKNQRTPTMIQYHPTDRENPPTVSLSPPHPRARNFHRWRGRCQTQNTTPSFLRVTLAVSLLLLGHEAEAGVNTSLSFRLQPGSFLVRLPRLPAVFLLDDGTNKQAVGGVARPQQERDATLMRYRCKTWKRFAIEQRPRPTWPQECHCANTTPPLSTDLCTTPM